MNIKEMLSSLLGSDQQGAGRDEIVGRLLTPVEMSTIEGADGRSNNGVDYIQSSGNYSQSTGGTHAQSGGGSYSQSAPPPGPTPFCKAVAQ